MRPKHLAIELSKLLPHPCHSVELEQYMTEGDLASYWIRAIDQLDDLEGKRILDLGAGNGILAIGCMLMGASHVTLIEGDERASEVASHNLEKITQKYDGDFEIRNEMITASSSYEGEVPNIVVMNPPWGVQTPRADRPIMQYAFSLKAPVVHVLHSANAKHLQALGIEYGYESEAIFETEFRLPPTYQHHTKKKATTTVRCWRFFQHGDARMDVHDDAE